MIDFEGGWRDRLARRDIGLVEVDAMHPFHRFYGLDADGRAQVVFFSEDRPPNPPISNLVEVVHGQRKGDGLWTLSLTLLDQRFTEIFVRLGADLVQRSQSALDSRSGLALVMTGLDEWRRLLNPKTPDRLSEEKLRGLVAEVWAASSVLVNRHKVRTVVDGWLGPFGNPQDFHFPGTGSVEVKAIRPGAKSVKVSSAEQLDASWLELEFFVVTLADAGREEQDAVSLCGLAGRLRLLHVKAGGTGDEVDSRFKLLGVDLTDEYYADRLFIVHELQTYSVPDLFPAIRASALPTGISSVKYEIARASMEAFLTSSQQVRT
jgi:hypothetical protein